MISGVRSFLSVFCFLFPPSPCAVIEGHSIASFEAIRGSYKQTNLHSSLFKASLRPLNDQLTADE